MTEPAAVVAASGSRQKAKQVPSWHQQPGENNLWYARFLRYVALGPSRSVSLVATGKRNHYPVPAHWPMVAKQRSWKERATTFDEAARKDEAVLNEFNTLLGGFQLLAPPEEALKLQGRLYELPPPDDDEHDSQTD